MFLTARRFMYQQVYFHRTVRAIDLDLAGLFEPSIRAIFGDGSPADRLGAYADLDEYALLHQAARWARGESVATDPSPGDGTVTGAVADGWRAILLRQPTWRSDVEVRAEYEAGDRPEALIATLGPAGARASWRSTWPRSTRDPPTPRPPTPCCRSRAATAASCRSRTRSRRSRPTGSSPGATGGSTPPR